MDNFEDQGVGSMPVGWTRVGGSSGDWRIITDGNKVFAQDQQQSATLRVCYASSAAGTPWPGATTLTSRVKVLVDGSTGTSAAMVCLRYTTTGDYHCLALMPGMGARIKTRSNGVVAPDGPLWSTTITTGTWYTVRLVVDQSNVLTAYLNNTLLGTYVPTASVGMGYAAIATQSSEAAFDDIVVTRP